MLSEGNQTQRVASTESSREVNPERQKVDSRLLEMGGKCGDGREASSSDESISE